MNTVEPIQTLASRCMSVRKENPGTVLSVEWVDNEEQGMILYHCPTFKQDSQALLNNLQLRYQFKPHEEVKPFVRNLLSFRLGSGTSKIPPDVVRGINKVVGYSVGDDDILNSYVTGYPQRQFYLSQGKLLTNTEQGVVGVIHIRIAATVFPPKIQRVEIVGVKVTSTGKRQFVQINDDCNQAVLLPQTQQLF